MAKNDSSSRILMVVAQNDFRDEEFFEPKKIFESKDAKISVASLTTDTAKGMLGGTVKPDVRIADAKADDYDAIVIAGGMGSKKYLWENKKLHNLIDDGKKKEKVIAAICISPVVLAKTGILKDKKCTVFNDPQSINEIKKYGGIYENKDVVVDGDIITARDPKSAKKIWKRSGKSS
ncbi:ThiJ/PfpI domain protein [Methanosalsum zhilinae DSM 4017]|uniref:ThiJ/PfpI domain protein n=1 Tax=Methanosalsum zhilinae (strain DSM 4017 / NBRC 107636 / OCM 62 / WeN5) TaxID=679901 RepID=F7XL07_METZD|nr:DJ-1/PfpI family protein [Methanosalsum zhilinae]AEH60710.1 ThiJ/PfpI domain protein [Methanosalsum zhilinae DSM 4017]